MTAADDLMSRAERYGDELDVPTLRPGDAVNVRVFSGLTGFTTAGRLVLDDSGQLVVEVVNAQPAGRVWSQGGSHDSRPSVPASRPAVRGSFAERRSP